MHTQALVLAHPVSVRVKMVAVNNNGSLMLKVEYREEGGGGGRESLSNQIICTVKPFFKTT